MEQEGGRRCRNYFASRQFPPKFFHARIDNTGLNKEMDPFLDSSLHVGVMTVGRDRNYQYLGFIGFESGCEIIKNRNTKQLGCFSSTIYTNIESSNGVK